MPNPDAPHADPVEELAARDRAAGLLLHPTSLPGPHGIGDLGQEAHDFVDFLVGAGCRLWQILPLGPTGYGNSPYAGYSAFAGNPLLVSLEALVQDGWLKEADLADPPSGRADRVDFDAVAAWKLPRLEVCCERFFREAGLEEQGWFDGYCRSEAGWLDDYALYMAIKDDRGGAAWQEWPDALRRREADALAEASDRLADAIRGHKFRQFLFDRQWQALKTHCSESGLRLVGDVPIFVALDSADVWTHQDLFKLKKDGSPRAVAGVPPDYFSKTGQYWGNPVYDWPKHRETGYAWWIARLEAVFRQVEVVRIDHFRGFAAYWEIPADESTAVNGEWVPGPGAHFLEAIRTHFGDLPFIAEDLGTITPDVHALRERFGLPGMRVLQFAFGEEDPKTASYLPHNHERTTVVYTGTHDNDTSLGWFRGEDEDDPRPPGQQDAERRRFAAYIGLDPDAAADLPQPHWAILRTALASVGDWAVAPVQDVLGLGSAARMNRPGALDERNWSWRLTPEQFDRLRSDPVRERLRDLAWRYGRM